MTSRIIELKLDTLGDSVMDVFVCTNRFIIYSVEDAPGDFATI